MNRSFVSTSLKSILGLGALAALTAFGGEPGEVAGEESSIAPMAILGSDACKNVDINIVNGVEIAGVARRIKVLSVDLYSASEGRWLREDLGNVEIESRRSRTWNNEDLQYAENDTITKARVHLKYREDDGDWSDEITRSEDIEDLICVADTFFHITIR